MIAEFIIGGAMFVIGLVVAVSVIVYLLNRPELWWPRR